MYPDFACAEYIRIYVGKVERLREKKFCFPKMLLSPQDGESFFWPLSERPFLFFNMALLFY